MATIARMRRLALRRHEAATHTLQIGGETFRLRFSGAAERQAREQAGGADPVPALPRLVAAAARVLTGIKGMPLVFDLFMALFDAPAPRLERGEEEAEEDYAERVRQVGANLRKMRLANTLKRAGLTDESSLLEAGLVVLRECSEDLLPVVAEVLTGEALEDAYLVLWWGLLGGCEDEWRAAPQEAPTLSDVRSMVDPPMLPAVMLQMVPALMQVFRDVPAENREAQEAGPPGKSPAPSSVAG